MRASFLVTDQDNVARGVAAREGELASVARVGESADAVGFEVGDRRGARAIHFDVTMDNSDLMCRRERTGDLDRNVNRFVR